VKLPSATYDGVPENEYAMMSLARAVGITVPDVRLIGLDEIEGLPGGLGRLAGQALAVKRFDRAEDGSLIHIEDFAQVFGVYPENKYKRATYRNIAEVLWAETGEEGISEFIRRLVFNALIGNADMHLKNWSLIYPDRHTAAIAPGYDFVSTIPYIEDDAMALKLVRSKKMAEFSIEALAHLAAKARLPEKLIRNVAREAVARFKDVWASEIGNLPLSEDALRLIADHVRTVPVYGE